MPNVEVEPGVKLFYEINGTGKTILFVHGWTMNHDVWEYQVSELSKKYRTVVLDLRGHGASDKPGGKYTYDVYARDLENFIAQVGLEDFTFVGWSMGAAIGLHYITRFASRASKFVSVDGVIPYFVTTERLPFGPSRQEVNSWIRRERTDRPEFTKGFVDTMFCQPNLKYTKLWIWNICMQATWHSAIESLKLLRDTNLSNSLEKVQIPTAIFHGVHDEVVPIQFAQYTQQRIPGSIITAFNYSGHAPFIEENQAFNQALVNFVR